MTDTGTDPIALEDLVAAALENWPQADGVGSIAVRVYHLIDLAGMHEPAPFQGVRLDDLVTLIFFRGRLRYLTASGTLLDVVGVNMKDPLFESGGSRLSPPYSHRRLTFGQPVMGHSTTPPSVWSMLLTPYPEPREARAVHAARHRLDEAAAVCTVVQGKNLLFEVLVEAIYNRADHSLEIRMWDGEHPDAFPAPSLVGQRLTDLRAATGAALAQGPHRGRLHLSLRWYLSAAHETDSIDRFLKLWIAVEALGMPGRDGISDVEALLGDAYGETLSEVRDRYQLGFLHGLRSNIMHYGYSPLLEEYLPVLLDAIYRDLFYTITGIASHRFAPAYVSSHAAQLSACILQLRAESRTFRR